MIPMLVMLQVVAGDTRAIEAKASAALATAQAVQAAQPPVCTSIPSPDTLSGSMGTGTPCTPRPDNTRPTQVIPTSATTAADGTFSGSWPGGFPSSPTTAMAQAKSTAEPYTCQLGTWTASTYSGKCWRISQQLTLPTLTTSLLGLVLPVAPTAPAGVTVSIVGRQ